MTLMINDWPAKMSNDIMEACFVRDKKPFAQTYEDLKTCGRVKPEHQIRQADVKIKKNEPSVSCYFIALESPIVFEGITKIYY